MNALARIITIIFHPLLLATYLFSLFTLVLPAGMDPIKDDGHWSFVFLIFCVTFLLPALNIGIFRTFGSIRSMAMEARQERIVPFTFVTILYCVVTYLFYSRTRVGFNDNLLKFLIVIDLLVVLATVVTFFYKISVHSLAWWGLIGILLPLNNISEDGALFYPTIGSIALAGIIMSARLQLQVHTTREVMVGAAMGFCATFVAMIILF